MYNDERFFDKLGQVKSSFCFKCCSGDTVDQYKPTTNKYDNV